jgi:putative tricarboxylic transport membrane protein
MESDAMAVKSALTRRQAEITFAAALIAAASAIFIEAGKFPPDSAGYPRSLAVLLGIGALLVIAREVRRPRESGVQPFFDHPIRFVAGSGFLVAYFVMIDFFGYLLPSVVFAIGLPFVLGYREWRLLVPVVLGTLAVILLIFRVILERPLPPDLLNFLLEALP